MSYMFRPQGQVLVTRTMTVGKDYMVGSQHARFIRSTPKGFNLLNMSSSKCILRHPLYRRNSVAIQDEPRGQKDFEIVMTLRLSDRTRVMTDADRIALMLDRLDKAARPLEKYKTRNNYESDKRKKDAQWREKYDSHPGQPVPGQEGYPWTVW